MEDPASLIDGLRQSWRALLPGTMERTMAAAVLYGLFYYLFVLLVERLCGTRTGNYRTRGFAHDAVYYFYLKTGLEKLVFPVALFTALREPLSFLDLRLVSSLPFALQFLAWLVVADFVQYWVHRAKHHYKFLWAFHTTHHSQEHVNFATFARVHPVEDLIGQFVHVVLLLVMGLDPVSSFALYLCLDFVNETQHSRIPWKLGPLYRVFVTPTFHLHHHSTDPAHHDRNFAVLFSAWDFLFGTAVKADSPIPTKFGLDDVKPTSLVSTLVMPFRLLYRFYAPGQAREKPAA